jgi:nucleotide-binding universal stress UspA family protein
MLSSHTVLLASEGRPFADEAVQVAARLARETGGAVRVLCIARMYGTSLGLQNPGLRPNKHELEQHENTVDQAIRALKRARVEADGHIIATRKATKTILGEARRQSCEVIVMGADRRRNRFVANLLWGQEPYRVQRRASIAVELVDVPPER